MTYGGHSATEKDRKWPDSGLLGIAFSSFFSSGYEHLFEWWKIKNKCCGRRRHHKLPEVDNPIPIGVKDVEDLDKMVFIEN